MLFAILLHICFGLKSLSAALRCFSAGVGGPSLGAVRSLDFCFPLLVLVSFMSCFLCRLLAAFDVVRFFWSVVSFFLLLRALFIS